VEYQEASSVGIGAVTGRNDWASVEIAVIIKQVAVPAIYRVVRGHHDLGAWKLNHSTFIDDRFISI
jgi:hypothetical protein